MSDRPKCETCPLFDEPKGSVSMMGRCRRFPSEVVKHKGSFCGEHPDWTGLWGAAEPEDLTAPNTGTNADEAEGST